MSGICSLRLFKPFDSAQRNYVRRASTHAKSLAGKKCIITGASRGIGRAIAERFSAEGAACVLVSRNAKTLDDLLKELPDPQSVEDGSHVHSIRAGDVAQRVFWEGIAKEIKVVDILVNAAGTTHYSLLMATQEKQIEEVIQTNLMGPVWSCQMIVKNMIRRKKGCIINVSSLLGAKGGKGSAAYVSSKAGIIGLTRSLAAEVGPAGVRVNVILPGYIETAMTDAMTPDAKTQALNSIPLKRFGTSSEIADAALFLATNSYANNCVLNLDGGLSAT